MKDTSNAVAEARDIQKTAYPILFAIAFAHLLNDMLQSVIPSAYPILKESYRLSFTQIGLITFAYQMAASILQPFVGFYTDKKPQPHSQVYGMLFTLCGIVLLSFANHFYIIIPAVVLVGIGSSIFHPEASRISFLASGGRRGLAQSVFQLGGNAGTAVGPLLVALLVVPNGQRHILLFVAVAVLALAVLSHIARWYGRHLSLRSKKPAVILLPGLPKNKVRVSVAILLVLIFSKFFYTAGMSSYFTFYLIEKFGLSVQD
ncbi:MAG TPA: MFS transporter, partial [Flavobacterium sp.]|nr:MFS transporter [Flavobacterium sp.]